MLPSGPEHRVEATPPDSSERPRRPVVSLVLATIVLGAVMVVAGPTTLRLVALVTVADGLGFDPPRPLAPDVVREPVRVGDMEVDRYRPLPEVRRGRLPSAVTNSIPEARHRPAIVLLPGATPAGRDDRRVVDIATAIARADRVVVVPELAVYDAVLLPADVDRIVEVALALVAEHDGVVLTGLSFGGSLGVIAAADDRLRSQVDLVATFGSYADLAGVIQAASTGTSLVDDRRIPWEPDPRAATVVRTQVLELLEPSERAQVTAALDGELDPPALPRALRAVHDLLTDSDPTRTFDHLEASPDVVRRRIAELSPTRAAAHLTAPLVTLHAVDDPVIPVGEQARFAAAYPQARALELTTFDHVGLTDDGRPWWVTAADLWQTARFMHEILDAR